MVVECLRLNSRRFLLALAAFLVPLLPVHAESPAAGAANGVGTAFEMTFWQQVAGSDDPAMLDAYLQQYPTGTFAPLARARLAAIARQSKVATPPVAVAVLSVVPVAPVASVVDATKPAPAPVPARAGPTIANPGLRAALANLQHPAVPLAVSTGSLSQPVSGLPPRPQLASVPTVSLPDHFCSADARNAFYENIYKPALEIARRNNADAGSYVRQLRAIYDGYGLGRDTEAMNKVAAESSAYQPVAGDAYAAQSGLVRTFDTLMAVPVTACEV